MASQVQHPNLPLPDYFSKFASIYVHQTGHSTLDIFADSSPNMSRHPPTPSGWSLSSTTPPRGPV